MSLKHTLLGFLSSEPMTGYDLKQRIERSINHFWNAKLSQIYPALSTMKDEGWVTMEVQHQENRPNRKIYHITTTGREELNCWLRKKGAAAPVRNTFLIKTFFGANLKEEEMLAQLRHHLALHEEQLATYQETVRGMIQQRVASTGSEREGFFWELTLDMGIRHEQGWIEWCQETIVKIKAMTG